MARAYSISEILAKKYKTIPWGPAWTEAYENPEVGSLITLCGHSGSGKTGLAMEISKELATVLGIGNYNSPEQGTRMTLKKELIKHNMNTDFYKRRILFTKETMAEMMERFAKHKAPKWAVVDSVKTSKFTYKEIEEFRAAFPSVTLILTLRARGREPENALQRDLWYDSDLKIWVEGFRGISHGRLNPGGFYTIYEKGAADYWGIK